MTYSRSVGLELPSEFDVTTYDSVNERAAKYADPNVPAMKNAWHVYASAWNGVAFRLRAAMDYHQDFAQSIVKSTAPAGEERNIQERALFGCAAAALSAIECFYMATYGLGAILAPHFFPLKKASDLIKNPGDVAQCFLDGFPNVPFSKQLDSIAKSSQLRSLGDFRNSLAHRGVLPRQHYLTLGAVTNVPSAVPENPKALAKDFNYIAYLNVQTTEIHSRWLLEILNVLVRGFDDFLMSTTPKLTDA